MVIIDYPDVSCRKFFLFQDTLLGPFDLSGGYSGISIDMDLTGSYLEQSRGIYDENNVEHTSFHGRIFYYPVLADCIPSPTTLSPRSLKMPYKESTNPVTALRGFGCPNVGAFVGGGTSARVHQTVLRDGTNWSLIRIVQASTTASCSVARWDLSFNRWLSPTSIEMNYQSFISYYAQPWPFAGKTEVSYEAIMAVYGKVTKWSPGTKMVKSYTAYTTDPSIAYSPARLKQHLEIFVNNQMEAVFPIPEADYGDLAARAVKQKNTLDMNVFEFLRDLPNAKEMIPRLKNLKSLKTHAGNFLAFKYGILPTASDLMLIIGAFKARKPYFDKFGSQVFNASNRVVQEVGLMAYTLDQYVKVPIANEDCDLQRLLDALDNFGMGLTLSNAWDLVKLSFVLDWFIDVGGFLERIDNNLRLLRYNIPYVTMSCKKTAIGEISPSNSNLMSGPIEWRYYHRWVSSHCPLPPLTLSITPTISNHWLEASALLVQLKR